MTEQPSERNNLIMGIDQSFTSCGVVILDESGEVVVAQIIKSDKRMSDFQRSWTIFNEISKLSHRYSIKNVAIEGLAFGKFGNATRSLAILQGVLVTNLLYLKRVEERENNIERVEIVTPSCLKKFATGKGKATKKDMIAHVPQELVASWKRDWSSKSVDDLADAYFLAKYFRNKLNVTDTCTDKEYVSSQTAKTLIRLLPKN